jgi:hypothetical protein
LLAQLVNPHIQLISYPAQLAVSRKAVERDLQEVADSEQATSYQFAQKPEPGTTEILRQLLQL